MVALVAEEGAHPHRDVRPIGEVCRLMTRQVQVQALPAVKGTAASGPAQPDVLKAISNVLECCLNSEFTHRSWEKSLFVSTPWEQ